MVEEMIKFREELDKRNIEWIDKSEHFDLEGGGAINIDRTHFMFQNKKYSVVNGFGTYGGENGFEENKGLLELCGFKTEPIGYLTADEVLKKVGLY